MYIKYITSSKVTTWVKVRPDEESYMVQKDMVCMNSNVSKSGNLSVPQATKKTLFMQVTIFMCPHRYFFTISTIF